MTFVEGDDIQKTANLEVRCVKKRHAAVLLLLFAVTALCAVLGEGAASRASVLRIDPRDAGSIEAFIGRWLSEEADDLKYTAATIDVGSCEYRVLAVAEEPPYAALCFDVWSTEEVEGTGRVRVMACFEDEGDGYSYIAGRTSTQMQGFKHVLNPLDGGPRTILLVGFAACFLTLIGVGLYFLLLHVPAKSPRAVGLSLYVLGAAAVRVWLVLLIVRLITAIP